jgi:hypothetical protein
MIVLELASNTPNKDHYPSRTLQDVNGLHNQPHRVLLISKNPKYSYALLKIEKNSLAICKKKHTYLITPLSAKLFKNKSFI